MYIIIYVCVCVLYMNCEILEVQYCCFAHWFFSYIMFSSQCQASCFSKTISILESGEWAHTPAKTALPCKFVVVIIENVQEVQGKKKAEMDKMPVSCTIKKHLKKKKDL